MVNLLALTFLISLLVQIFFFIFAAYFKTDLFTDLSYGATFIIIAFFLAFQNAPLNSIQIISLLAVTAWGTRLITYLFLRIKKIKKDARFDDIRGNILKFAQFWFFQAVSVWVIMLPVIVITGVNINSLSPFSYIGLFVWLTGLIIEALADVQKFIAKSRHPDRWADNGLWAYSRHPNYLGEIMLWWGIFILAAPYLSINHWWAISGPLYITGLLLFVSGIPPLEKRWEKKYGNNEEFQQYKKSTPKLLFSTKQFLK